MHININAIFFTFCKVLLTPLLIFIKLIYFLKEIFSLITSVSCSLYNYTTVTFSYYIVGETGSFISVERCSITDLLFHWYWLWWYDRILKL